VWKFRRTFLPIGLCARLDGVLLFGEEQLTHCDDNQRTCERNQPDYPGYLLDLALAFLNLAQRAPFG